ncbi:hypothetical protein IW261DRAFT_1421846 [Armillaria novae-zelandiae]|uniref:Uncharacterized protein n=1 Tax=Armillaria novae-zelandiae TaxID=153914 RepID=A0AA39TAG6_9AGAR|nr:hypothetical protein IW261DRAFT_1421846 [Armillaria novae-zelandiae]
MLGNRKGFISGCGILGGMVVIHGLADLIVKQLSDDMVNSELVRRGSIKMNDDSILSQKVSEPVHNQALVMIQPFLGQPFLNNSGTPRKGHLMHHEEWRIHYTCHLATKFSTRTSQPTTVESNGLDELHLRNVRGHNNAPEMGTNEH